MATILRGTRTAFLPLVSAILILGLLICRHLYVAAPPLLICDLEQRAGSGPIAIPGETSAVRKLHVEGNMKLTGHAEMASFAGSATWADGPAKQAQVWGDVFLDKGGAVDGLFLMVGQAEWTEPSLKIATLNRNGILDRDATTAFLFVDPGQKLAHAATYTCTRHAG